MTNGDMIRGMRDEELARWIERTLSPSKCPPDRYPSAICNGSTYNCERCYLRWLRKQRDARYTDRQ